MWNVFFIISKAQLFFLCKFSPKWKIHSWQVNHIKGKTKKNLEILLKTYNWLLGLQDLSTISYFHRYCLQWLHLFWSTKPPLFIIHNHVIFLSYKPSFASFFIFFLFSSWNIWCHQYFSKDNWAIASNSTSSKPLSHMVFYKF